MMPEIPETPSPWEAMADALRLLGRKAALEAPDAGDELARADADWMLLTGVGQYIASFRAQNPDNPQFTPFLNSSFNQSAPVPDYMYQSALVDGSGAYRISGRRGTSLFVELQQMDGLDGMRTTGRALERFDLDELAIDADGRFSVLLSAERPEGYEGDWRQLDPTATTVLIRHASYDWLNEVDARVAIERLDKPARQPRRSVEAVNAALAGMSGWAERRVAHWNRHVRAKREQGIVNRLELYDTSKVGSMAGQVYFEGLYDIGEDEALLIETEVPETCLYWSILVTDDQYATIDWTAHQSSLNGFQARLDSDGRFRCVIARKDPGVPNWIDTGDHATGAIQHRWMRASSAPVPAVRLVMLADLPALLPPDTPKVSAEERDRALRLRREGAQMRGRW